MPENVDGQQILLGAGKVYVDPLTTAAARTGELFLGECSDFTVTISAGTELELRSRASSGRPIIAADIIGQTFTVSLVAREFSKTNMALALGGDVSALAQGTASVTNEVISGVIQGRYYQVGAALAKRRKISAVVVTGPSATPVYVVNTDYKVDAERGRIYIVEGGAITTGLNLEVDYTYAAATNATFSAGLRANQLCYMRFVPDNTRGPNHEIEIWKINLSSREALAFIGEDYASFTLTGKIEADLVGHPTAPYLLGIAL